MVVSTQNLRERGEGGEGEAATYMSHGHWQLHGKRPQEVFHPASLVAQLEEEFVGDLKLFR